MSEPQQPAMATSEPSATMGALPGPAYSNGVLALDANSGELRGFFQPSVSAAYRPTDQDLDMSGSPSLFTNSAAERSPVAQPLPTGRNSSRMWLSLPRYTTRAVPSGVA